MITVGIYGPSSEFLAISAVDYSIKYTFLWTLKYLKTSDYTGKGKKKITVLLPPDVSVSLTDYSNFIKEIQRKETELQVQQSETV
jgi:hypothetical protein